MKKKSLILLPIVFVLLTTSALAGTSTSGIRAIPGNSELFSVYDFKFDILDYGIHCGVCPVYTAPSTYAFRAANGKAAVDTSDRVDVAGFENGWLLVRYSTKSGYRVGYIPPQYVRDFRTNMEFHFSHIRQTAIDYIALTDNPMDNYSVIAYLEPGEVYYILGKYTYYGNWWYVECEVDGQPARGFISRDTTFVDPGDGNYTTDLGDPPYGPNGSCVIGHVIVSTDNSIVRADAGVNYNMVARAHLSDRYPAYGTKRNENGKIWYNVFVDGVWGWMSEAVCYFEQ